MARRDTAARRYAEAAFEIGRADGTLELWERDLLKLRDAFAVEDVRTLIEHPALAYAEKERVVRRIVGDVLPEALNLVLLMVRRGRPKAIDPHGRPLPDAASPSSGDLAGRGAHGARARGVAARIGHGSAP